MDKETADGLLVIEGNSRFGFLRLESNNYARGYDDIYISQDLIYKNRLRPADRIYGTVKAAAGDRKHREIAEIIHINKQDPKEIKNRPIFDELIPTHPSQIIRLEHNPKEITSRIIDLVAPIGRGQRCMVVAPPKAGKSTILQNIAIAIQKNHPDIILVVLLIDERPEEVTEMREIVNGSVVASTFDEQPERHAEVAEVVVERAKRLAEMNGHVVILLDSITRLARAYNTITPPSGRIMSGGLDARALPAPKKIFGAARNLRGAGSITIIGTALVDTGSKMDEVIFEEFKGTGNSEIHLDRKLFERRIFPCIDIPRSGTRREELLVDSYTKDRMWAIRNALAKGGPVEIMEVLRENILKTTTNKEFLQRVDK